MKQMNPDLKLMLRQDVADKGRAPVISFSVFAAMIFFYSFSALQYQLLIRISAVVIFGLAADRLRLIDAFKLTDGLDEKKWNYLRLNIWANMLTWSFVFTVISFETSFSGIYFIVLNMIIARFVTSSIITISSKMSLFVPFQIIMMGPQVCFIAYDSLTENKYGLWALIPIYLVFFVYQMWQAQSFRNKVIAGFQLQLDLKKSNQELREIQAAQTQQTIKLIHTSRLAALGEMAAGIAHEVNNPLAIISGNLQQLERKIASKDFTDDLALKKHIERSLQSIDRITKIITGLRLFSQQSDSLPKARVSLPEIFRETLDFCSEMLKARYVRLELSEVPQVFVQCHPVQISQVLINLIKNAEDALTDQSEEHRWVRISFKVTAEHVEIFVKNGGPKITPELREKLFIPFFTTKIVGKGTGLGLSISKGIVEEHGGDLSFNDQETETTFTISLPVG